MLLPRSVSRKRTSSKKVTKKQKANTGNAVPVYEPGAPLPKCAPVKLPPRPDSWSLGRLNWERNLLRGHWKPIKGIAPPPSAAPFECKAKSHWTFKRYRNKYGVYADWPSLVDYFQTITPDPAGFVRRNMKMALNLQKHFKKGRFSLNRCIETSDNIPANVRAEGPLATLQKEEDFRAWIAEVTGSPFEQVCANTQAYVVLFVRASFKLGDAQKAVTEFAGVASKKSTAAAKRKRQAAKDSSKE